VRRGDVDEDLVGDPLLVPQSQRDAAMPRWRWASRSAAAKDAAADAASGAAFPSSRCASARPEREMQTCTLFSP
jgi:hypothetical protein